MGYLFVRKEILILQCWFSLCGQVFQLTLPRELSKALGESFIAHVLSPLVWAP